MLSLEPEGAGHPAAAGVELGHLGAGNPLEQFHGGLGAGQRLLMAVAVEDDPAARHGRGRIEAQRPVVDRLHQQILDELGLPGDRFRARVAGEQREVFLAQRQ